MTAFALFAIAGAMLLVRAGWERRTDVSIAGWTLAAAALAMLAAGDGAWGLAMGTVVAIATAVAVVLHAGWMAPVRLQRAPREAPSITLPRVPRELARRMAVFVLVVPVAFAAAQWLAFGAQAVVRGQGAAAADATVLTLFLQPVLWAGLMAWQMTRSRASRMIAAPAGAAAFGTLLWSMA